jgi:hypothetical protein
MKKHTNFNFGEESLEYITDTTCKYGHLLGWNTENDCYKCSDCGELIPLKEGEHKPILISEII